MDLEVCVCVCVHVCVFVCVQKIIPVNTYMYTQQVRSQAGDLAREQTRAKEALLHVDRCTHVCIHIHT